MYKISMFQVIGPTPIHCEGCETRIARALQRIRGVCAVEASHTTQVIRVQLNPDLAAPDEILARLATLGYAAEVMVS